MEIIGYITEGLATVFTDYVPALAGAVVDGAKALFVVSGTSGSAGSIVLGIVVVVAGIAICTSLMRLPLKLLRIKRHA